MTLIATHCWELIKSLGKSIVAGLSHTLCHQTSMFCSVSDACSIVLFFNLHAAFEGQWANSCLDTSLCKQVTKLISYMLLWMVLVRDCHWWSYCRYVYFLLLLKVLVRDCHCCSYCRCVVSISLFLVLCFLCSFFWVLEVLLWRPFSHLKWRYHVKASVGQVSTFGHTHQQGIQKNPMVKPDRPVPVSFLQQT